MATRAMISGHFRPVAPELLLVPSRRAVGRLRGADWRESVRTLFKALAAAALATSAACPAFAQQHYADELTPTPDIEKVGPRYVLMVLDQPDRDLTHGRTKVNV